MRLLLGIFAAGLLGTAAFQSVIGPAIPTQAETSQNMDVGALAICDVAVASAPVIETVTTEYTETAAHKRLIVTPAVFGSETEEIILTPAHREGATFRTEQKRIVTAEPTRRLRAIPAEFEPVPAFEPLIVRRHRIAGGELVPVDETIEFEEMTREVSREATIMSVRLSAGLELVDIREIEQDGTGAPVPAETRTITRRTVEAHPKVGSEAIAATTARAEIRRLVTPASVSTAPALCELDANPALVTRIQRSLSDAGAWDGAADGVWTPELADALALWQERQTGLVAAAPLLEAVPALLPDLKLPTG